MSQKAFPALVLLILACSGPAAAQPWTSYFPTSVPSSGFYDLRMVAENDAYIPGRSSDRAYTNGLRLQVRTLGRVYITDMEGSVFELRRDDRGALMVARDGKAKYLTSGVQKEGEVTTLDLDNTFPATAASNGHYILAPRRTNAGFVLGQNIYTPSDISKTEPQMNDRPYAGWFWGGLYLETVTHEEVYYKYGVYAGCIGPCAFAEKTQTWVHKHIANSSAPKGWANQVRDEFGLQIGAEYMVTALALSSREHPARRSMDLSVYFKGSAGNIFDDFSAGFVLRLGVMDSYFNGFGVSSGVDLARQPSRPEDMLWMSRIGGRPVRMDLGPVGGGHEEWYLLLRAESKFVIHNALLQGGQYGENDVYTVTPYRAVVEGEAMGVYRHESFFFQYGAGFISTEFQEQQWTFPRQVYGRIEVAVRI